MSRIGKLPVKISAGVTVTVAGQTVKVKGAKGELAHVVNPEIKVEVQGDQVIVSRSNDTKKVRALHGLIRALIANMVKGVSEGYEKKLEVIGVGYRAAVKGVDLEMALGFSHPVVVKPLPGVKFAMDETAEKGKIIVKVMGYDKQAVGQMAALVRGYRLPEPYKGKGIRYVGEHVRRKAGKTAAAK